MPRHSTSSKPKPSCPRKRAREPSSDSTPSLEPSSSLALDKSLVLSIIIAKLESSNTCDWFALSQTLDAYSTPQQASKRAKGKKGKIGSEGGGGMSGTEIHDLYHNVILPALKSGRALWADDAIATDLALKHTTPVTETEDGPTTPPEDEGEDDDVVIAEQEGEEEEGDGMLLEELEELEKKPKKSTNKRPPAAKKQTYGGAAKRARTAKGGAKKYTAIMDSDEEVGGGGEEYETVSDDD